MLRELRAYGRPVDEILNSISKRQLNQGQLYSKRQPSLLYSEDKSLISECIESFGGSYLAGATEKCEGLISALNGRLASLEGELAKDRRILPLLYSAALCGGLLLII